MRNNSKDRTMTNGTSGRNKAIILAVLAVLAVGAGIAAFLLFTGGEEPAPTASTAAVATEAPAPTPATTPATAEAEAVGSIPQTGFTEVPTVQQEAPPDVVLWQEDGLDDLEQYAVRSLEVIQLANPGAAQALTDLPWMSDEMLLEERLTLASIEELAQADPTLAGQVVALPWLADRVDDEELLSLLQLNDIAQHDSATAQALVESPWVADGISEEEKQTLETIEQVAAADAATARALAGSSWVADGVSEEEQEGLAIVQAAAGSDPEQARELVSLAEASDGLSPENPAVDVQLHKRLVDYFETQIEPDFPALAEIIRGYSWFPHLMALDGAAIYGLGRIASNDAALAQRVAQWPWVAEGDLNKAQEDLLDVIYRLTWGEMEQGEILLQRGDVVVYSMVPSEDYLPEVYRQFVEYPWVAVGNPTRVESKAAGDLHGIYQKDPRLALDVMNALSLADGVQREEAAVLDRVELFSRYLDSSWGRAVFDLPWVADGLSTDETSGPALSEAIAVSVLWKLAMNDRSQGELLLNAPWFRDELTQENLALTVALTGACRLKPPYEKLIREGQVRSRILSTPTGDVTFFVVKRASLGPIGDQVMDEMENVIRATEDFMEHPWTEVLPNVILSVEPDFTYFRDSGGLNLGHYALVIGDPPGTSKAVLYHEIAHFYTTRGSKWLIEGGANFLESYTFHFTGETTMEASYGEAWRLVADNCAPRGQGTIHERHLATVDWTHNQWWRNRLCDYYLGERFLAALYLNLGREVVAASLRELWFSERPDFGSSPTKERILEIREERAYQAFLANTPPERQEEFRLLYHCLHGRPIEGYTPSGPCPAEPPPTFEDPTPTMVISEGPILAEATRPPDDSEVAAQDREALEALYHATGGPSWVNNTNWATDAPLDQWHGVYADNRGRVGGLSLPSNLLTGPIPPELARMTRLVSLDIDNNQLTGPIPPELGNLSNLLRLNLSKNQLTGPIPPELGSLANLTNLVLDGNQLTGPIPPELGSLAYLAYLRLDGNQLTGCVPATLATVKGMDLSELPPC